MNNYTVYEHKNKINNKRYIGITKQNPKNRWDNGNGYKEQTYFYRAIRKYGWDNFEHNILNTGISQEDAVELEKNYIKEYNTNNPKMGYNISSGGEYGFNGVNSVSYLIQSGRVNEKINKLQHYYKSKPNRYVIYQRVLPFSPQKIVYCYEIDLYFRNINVAAIATLISKSSIYKSCKNNIGAYNYHFFITKSKYSILTDNAKLEIEKQIENFKNSLENS